MTFKYCPLCDKDVECLENRITPTDIEYICVNRHRFLESILMPKKSKIFVLGDIHGNFNALMQCFERSNFDYENDTLIVLGDICDGFKYVKDCIDELLKIKNLILITGNHDEWALNWMKYGDIENLWYTQGGKATIESYKDEIPESHISFLDNSHYIFEDEYHRIFVHGGFIPELRYNDKHTLLWDRSLVKYAKMCHETSSCDIPKKLGKWKEIYVGHTTTEMFGSTLPLNFCNLWMLDTGAGFSGKLSIMDIDTNEYWQSDIATELYPNEKGR